MVREDVENPQLLASGAPTEDEDEAEAADVVGRTKLVVTASVGSEIDLTELRKLDFQMMIATLGDLFHHSTKLLDLFCPKGASDDAVLDLAERMRTSGTFEEKYILKVVPQFLSYKETFASQFYIDVSTALRALTKVPLNRKIKSGPWLPEDILYKANVSLMTLRLLPSEGTNAECEHGLEELDLLFPVPFLSSIGGEDDPKPGISALYNESFELALEVRTQYLILQLGKESGKPSFNPTHILGKIFYEGVTADGVRLKGWDIFLDAGGNRLPKEFEDAVERRISDLKSCFSNKLKKLVDLDRLDELFPYSAFVTKLAAWARSRADELDSDLRKRGGVDEVIRALRVEAGKHPDLILPAQGYEDIESQSNQLEDITLQSPRSITSRIAATTGTQSNPAHPVEVAKSKERIVYVISRFHVTILTRDLDLDLLQILQL
jgi:hypothetical protein